MTPLDIITTARHIFTDTDSDGYRQTNDELLRYVNDGLRECSTLAPQLFYTTGDMLCTPGQTEQAISFANAQALADVIRVKDGNAIIQGDMAAMSAFNPNWGQAPAGFPENWFRHVDDPLRFYLSRKAPTVMVIEIQYVRNPTVVGLNDEITDIPSTLQPALVNYVVAKAESKDDEHVNSGRAVAAYQQFVAALKPA